MRKGLAVDGLGTIGSLSSLNVREVSTETITALLADSFSVLWAWFSYGDQLRIHPTGMGMAITSISVPILAQGEGINSPLCWPVRGACIIHITNSHVLNSSYNSFVLYSLVRCLPLLKP